MKYTYNNLMHAHYADTTVIVPDQVAENQKDFDGKTFPALRHNPFGGRFLGRSRENVVRVTLRGDLYGLYSSGTGDMIVRSA